MHFIEIDGVDDIGGRDQRQTKLFSRDKNEG